jgi:hypothetical protein
MHHRMKSGAAAEQAVLANVFDSDSIHNSQFLLQTENYLAYFVVLRVVPWPVSTIGPPLNRLEIKCAR